MKILAAIAMGMSVGCVLQTSRSVEAIILAMQKPKIIPDMINFFPLLKLT